MAVDEVYPELLFSYGTLQLEAVQMATFGRRTTPWPRSPDARSTW